MFSRILVPLDQSSLAEQATGIAAAIARACHGEITLVLAHEMAAYDGFLDASWRDARTPEESIYIRSTAEELARGASVTVSGAVETGRAVDVIGRRANEVDADLIVMTSHGRTGLSRAWMGSVADGVIRSVSVPVLMLRPAELKHGKKVEPRTFRRILVPLDGSTTSSAILPAAAAMARCFGATLVLARVVIPVPLYVFDGGLPAYPSPIVDPDMTKQVEEAAHRDLVDLAQRLETDYTMRVETEVVIGENAATALLDLAKAKNVDLVAMTTHGRGASRLIVGSVTDKVLRGAHVPLLLLHPSAVRPNADREYSQAAEAAQ